MPKLDTLLRSVLEAVQKNPGKSGPEISDTLAKTDPTATDAKTYMAMKRLTEQGLLTTDTIRKPNRTTDSVTFTITPASTAALAA